MQPTTVPLHHRISGEGQPVILLHGLFGSGENLGGIARQLQADFQVHTLDLRNHGRSPHTATHTYADLAADVARYTREQTDTPAHVIGHSMGGKAAMRFALDCPTQIASVTVIDIAPRPYPHHHDTILAALADLHASPPPNRKTADTRITDAVPEPAVRQFLLKNLYRMETGEYGLRLNLQTLKERYDDIADWPDSSNVCTAPALFVVGGASDYVQASDRDRINRLFPKATGHIIPGGSHWLHAESPERVGDLISRFLAEVR